MIEQKDSTKSGLKLVFEANKENKFPLIIGTPQLAFLSSTLAYSPTDISSKDKTVYVKCMWRSVWFVGETSVYGGTSGHPNKYFNGALNRIIMTTLQSSFKWYAPQEAVVSHVHVVKLSFLTDKLSNEIIQCTR